ncbi:hypothetical protein HYV82_02185 [Candidatus Woesearchaeota archaeon]|nr:hypothetical protein [Candidatus Woesearchaeota archaeon]
MTKVDEPNKGVNSLEAMLSSMSPDEIKAMIAGSRSPKQLQAIALYLCGRREYLWGLLEEAYKRVDDAKQLHPRFASVEGLAEGVSIYNRAFLEKELQRRVTSYLRHGISFTLFGGDIAGLHYTNNAESWSAGDAKMDEAARIFSTHAQRADESLCVIGIDEYALVATAHPNISKLVESVDYASMQWSAGREGSPLLFGYGWLTEKAVDEYILKTIGKERPETRAEWKQARSGVVKHLIDELNSRMVDYKREWIYPYCPEFAARTPGSNPLQT